MLPAILFYTKVIMTIHSTAIPTGTVSLPSYTGHVSMLPFDLQTLAGLPAEFTQLVTSMLYGIKAVGTAYFTLHGRFLSANDTLRRPGAHTDGNYEPCGWSNGGGNGWKIGENGPAIDTQFHHDSYLVPTGGIILASSYPSCIGYIGDYSGTIGVGGDCRDVDLSTGQSFMLDADTIYYGNNHFIHESLPVATDTHRVLARITLPQDHTYEPVYSISY